MIHDPSAHEPLTAVPWDEERVREGIAAIVADAEAGVDGAGRPNHPRDDPDDGLVNWPPVVDAGQLDRVQWCHGAPEIVATLGDLMAVDLVLAGRSCLDADARFPTMDVW